MKINISKENKPSYECMIIAEAALEFALRAEEDWEKKHHYYTGFIFLAFAVEAMFIFYRKQVDLSFDKENDRTCRKKLHKETVSLCGINNFMGLKDYQTVKNCLEIRDAIAHGDFYESSFIHQSKAHSNDGSLTREVLAIHSAQFRVISEDVLRQGIDATKRIDSYIYENGFKQSERDVEKSMRSHLAPAFGSGRSSWYISRDAGN